jgi:hypothetical protein
MAITICNEGEALLLEAALGKTAAGNLKLKLFVSNTTPAHTDAVATYTEMSTQGYAEKTLTTSSWGAASAGTGSGTATANKASIAYAQQTFTADGTGGSTTVYGYYITNSAGTVLVGAERFASAKVMAVAGDAIKITPTLRLSTE